MHFATIILAFLILTPPWIFGDFGIFLPAWFLLGASAVWLVRIVAYAATGLVCRYPWRLLWRPRKHALVYPVAVAILITVAANVDVTLCVTMALHQAQLDRLAADMLAGKRVASETMWVYRLDSDDPISGCPTLRIPQSDEILVYHRGGLHRRLRTRSGTFGVTGMSTATSDAIGPPPGSLPWPRKAYAVVNTLNRRPR